MTSFFTKGFTVENNPNVFHPILKILDSLEWDQKDYTYWYWRPKETSVLKDALIETHEILSKQYISKIFSNYKFGYRDLWNGIDIGADNFHNDLNEGPNVFFLLYFNTMDDTTGGGIGFRDSVTKEETGFLYPQKYDVLLGSQQSSWEHRVEKMKKQTNRIVANFGFICDEL